jgi:hypothetical protein
VRWVLFCTTFRSSASLIPNEVTSAHYNPQSSPSFLSPIALHSTHSVIRRLVIVIMNRLIRTPRRRLIQVVPQIDVQLLPRANIPRRLIRAVHARNTPLQIVTAKRKRPVRVLRLGKRHAQAVVVDVARLADYAVEQLCRCTGRGYELHELAVDDLELTGCGVVP